MSKKRKANNGLFSDLAPHLKKEKPIEVDVGDSSQYRKEIILPQEKPLKPRKQYNKGRIWRWSILGVAIVTAAIVLPLTLLRSTQPDMIRNETQLKFGNGFRTNSTEFSIKHIGTGMYLSNPTSTKNQRLRLVSENEAQFWNQLNSPVFTFNGANKKLAIDSSMIMQDGENASVTYKDGIPVWGSSGSLDVPVGFEGTYNQEIIEIHRNGEKDEYAIHFREIDRYLGNPVNGELSLTKKPDWFELRYTGNTTISNAEGMAQHYKQIFDAPLGVGSQGAILGIRHDQSHKFLTNNGLGLGLSKDEHFNWFLGTNDLNTVTLNKLTDIAKGEYGKTHWHDQVSILGEKIIFTEAVNGYKSFTDEPSTTIPDGSMFAIELNPLDLTEQAFRFSGNTPIQNKYIGIVGGGVGITNEPSYFEFIQSPFVNADQFTTHYWGMSDPRTVQWVFSSSNILAIDYVEIRAQGVQELTERKLDTGWRGYNIGEQHQVLQMGGLEQHSAYHDIEMKVYRKKGAGNFITHLVMPPIHTAHGPIWDWPTPTDEISSTSIEDIWQPNWGPMDKGSSIPDLPHNWTPFWKPFELPEGESEVIQPIDIWDASHMIREGSPVGGEQPYVKVEDAGSKQVYQANFKNGTGIHKLDKVRVRVEKLGETNSNSRYVYTNEIDVSHMEQGKTTTEVFGKPITFEFDGSVQLNPLTEYRATLEWKQEYWEIFPWIIPEWEALEQTTQPINTGISDIKTITEREIIKLQGIPGTNWEYIEEGTFAGTIRGVARYATGSALPTDRITYELFDIDNPTTIIEELISVAPQSTQVFSSNRLSSYPELTQGVRYNLAIRVEATIDNNGFDDETSWDSDWSIWLQGLVNNPLSLWDEENLRFNNILI